MMVGQVSTHWGRLMRLYHTTTRSAGAEILSSGFRDTTGHYGFTGDDGAPLELTGVWFANRPLDVHEGAAGSPSNGDPVLVIAVEESEIAAYELSTMPELYREWCMPAEIANRHLLGVIYDPLDDDEVLWEDLEPRRH